MFRRFFHTVCSLWLLLILVFGATPKEFIHSFAHHHDTVHCCKVDGPTMENQHHHCSFLSFHLMAFEPPFSLPFIAPPAPIATIIPLQLPDERARQQVMAIREGRGPPAASYINS